MSRYNGDEGRVYIGDLPRDASEREIERVFREYGSVRSVWVARNPPGFAFVMFEDERDAEDAVKALDGSTICGVRARVKHSSDRPSGRPRPPMRRHFDPNDRCYRCNQRGHYAYDCDKYAGGGGGEGGRGGKSRRSYSRSRSRSYEKRRSYSRSPIHSRNRGRSFTPSRSRSK